MQFPPYHKKKEWRRLFAGIVLGAVIGYLFFLYVHGQLQEKYTEEYIEMNAKMNEMEAKYEGLLKNQEEDPQAKPLSVKDIAVSYTNAKKLNIDLLTQHELTTLVKQQLASIPGKDIKVVGSQVDLMIASVESKSYAVDDLSYELKVERLVVYETLSLNLEIIISP
ncbi:hypothetical protein QRD89_13010 [Halobacillus sp. ACCC02827]|uniref:sporulation membrane protein YtrI n=1 Tax=Bacillaceae TaxID=186817 RepID=UPI0002A4F984|nr:MULTISPECIES: sporulation membrane protein YtrI [Bacillaceae]ELK47293.1 hypothetical protein D479_07587 [Halobacillus sp. BAB-2008]QHT47408.1 hypothetical protein M662_13230 [Bacillus sp. SB49]WJE14631.1 hypothetical protein QRD89_13010 [Halobacillus sp. ACCC02827]